VEAVDIEGDGARLADRQIAMTHYRNLPERLDRADLGRMRPGIKKFAIDVFLKRRHAHSPNDR
jgi:hypothetical protein